MEATAAAVTFDGASLSQLAATADRATRRNLIVSLRRMADSLEDSTDTIHKFAHLDLEKAMIQLGYDLKILKVLADADGVKTIDDVAQNAGADPELIKRILRYYNTINVAREVGPHQYVATNITRNLMSDVCVAGIAHYHGLVSKEYQALPEFLKKNGYRNPTDETDTALMMGWDTKDTTFDIMLKVPNAVEDFHQDVGPDRPGRVINQDLPGTVARALPTPGVENMAHDFFEPQPVRGAKFYYMRGVRGLDYDGDRGHGADRGRVAGAGGERGAGAGSCVYV
ncbi:hypothetical protein PG994_012632 [Apiospora phragmitis]|uniref:Uncharacterized protein n=1 Tax=Apiospora phragmitis TaxID=2905665 RepID=A0ABR1TB10_9PEZI